MFIQRTGIIKFQPGFLHSETKKSYYFMLKYYSEIREKSATRGVQKTYYLEKFRWRIRFYANQNKFNLSLYSL